MRRGYLALTGATALLIGVGCSDRDMTVSGPRPRAALRDVVGPIAGAIFTTDGACTGTDLNIFSDKADVYIDGGPAHPGAAGLPDGDYYVKVTAPDGQLLGTSIGSGNDTPVHVTGGEFAQCYQLSAILITPPDPGYLDTPNPGGEYKVWVSGSSDFANDLTKTDNFKVRSGDVVQDFATVLVDKFYDANANGAMDNGETPTFAWQVVLNELLPSLSATKTTPASYTLLDPGTYSVTESVPNNASSWFITYKGLATGLASDNLLSSPKLLSTATAADRTITGIVVGAGNTEERLFGNVCVGAGGGLTLGFWSNPNGGALYNSSDNALLVSLNLKDNNQVNPAVINGNDFNPASWNSSAPKLKPWLLYATATNMAYMLSAQLAAMELNVNHSFVSASALIYAPGTNSANALGFATVGAVMAEANTELGVHSLTTTAGTIRSYQEALKNALDKANNNLNFVQTSCPATFDLL